MGSEPYHNMMESVQDRILSKIFSLGEKIRSVGAQGGCSCRPELSRGVWGHAPPPEFFFI